MDNPEGMDVDATDDNPVTLFTPKTPIASTDNNELLDPEIQPSKRRRKRSIVWEHFTIETVSPGCTKALCKNCKKSFSYITGEKSAGTSHLKRHIALGICPVIRQNNQLTPASETKNGSSSPPKKRQRASPGYVNVPLDHDHCYHEMAKMIIMHEYPLHMVEHPGFTSFVRTLQPQFNMVSFNTIHGDCVSMYLSEKQKLSDFIRGIPGQVNLTIDLWESNQSVGYAFLTGHFIDGEWNLHRRLLNFLMVPSPDSDSAFNQPVAACLSDWNLEKKLSTLTVDHSIANETAVGHLRGFVSVGNPFVLNGQLLIGNCYARVISRMAQDALGAMEGTIKKVRHSVKYVKANDSHENRFYEVKQQLQVPSAKDIFIDDHTKWNTTYHMLVDAAELKEVFSCLETCDPVYKMAPSVDEWKRIEILCIYLKLLFDAANILTGPTYPTANAFYHEVTKVQLELTQAAMSVDPFVSNLTKTLKERFDKYWNDIFLVLSIAVVVDPRFKMKLIEFSFSKIYGEDAGMWIKTVDDGIHDLYSDYTARYFPLLEAYVDHGISETETSQEVHFPQGLSLGVPQDQPPSILPQESNPPYGQPQEDQSPGSDYPQDGHSQDSHPPNGQPQEVHPSDDHLQEGHTIDGHRHADHQPQEGHTADGQPQEDQTKEALTQEGQPAEGLHKDGLLAEDLSQESQPMEGLSQDDQPAKGLFPDDQPAKGLFPDDQPAKRLPREGQPTEGLLQERQPMEGLSQESQPTEGLTHESQPTEGQTQESLHTEGLSLQSLYTLGLTQESQLTCGLPQVPQPTERLPQEPQPTEELPQEVNSAEALPQEGEREQAFHQECHPSDVLPEESHMSHRECHPSDVLSQEGHPSDMGTQEGHSSGLPQEGRLSDDLLQEGHHLEASSQEFPLITIGDSLSDFELYISEIAGHQQMKSELDQYLEESLMPRSQDFDILGWWRLNRTKYPTLSKMASDILSIPFSTLTPDSVFDTKIKKMDKYRSSLHPVTLEALICAKDWFQYVSSAPKSQGANMKTES